MGYLDEQGLAKTVLMIKEWVRGKMPHDTVITRKEYKCKDGSIAAGTPGTRGYQCSVSLAADIAEYGDPISCWPSMTYDSSKYIPVAMVQGDTLFMNLYRATSSAVTVTPDTFSATVVFVKKQ